jgi:hypothetical protein
MATDYVFVFGSNLAGQHAGGAALFARQRRGAELGVGEGRTGQAYAIPTCDAWIRPLPLDQISGSVTAFIAYARQHPELTFEITRIGCGIAGFRDDEIAPLFAGAPENCQLPEGWREFTLVTVTE